MSRLRLRISSSKKVPALSLRDFLWRPPPLKSSLQTSTGPQLEPLGKIDDLHRDFVGLATLVYLADRTVPRAAPGREREMPLQVSVSEPARWTALSEAFEDLLRFLTGDVWSLRFSGRRGGRGDDVREASLVGATSLFSGGADSLAGAVVLGVDEPPTLVSHWAASGINHHQTALAGRLTEVWGAEPELLQIHLGRRTKQLGTEEKFENENSSRSRSLLFLALGLAAASVRGHALTVAENGFASINVPLSGERRGALSTRTTHPAFLDGLAGLLQELGVSTSMSNPFQDLTKGQVFKQVRDLLDKKEASELLSASHSCAKSDMWRYGLSAVAHCGVCYGCLVRRAAFIAAKIDDQTKYANEILSGSSRKRFFRGSRLSTYESVQYAIEGGFTEKDILGLGLPTRVKVEAATRLANAGLAELGAVKIRAS